MSHRGSKYHYVLSIVAAQASVISIVCNAFWLYAVIKKMMTCITPVSVITLIVFSL